MTLHPGSSPATPGTHSRNSPARQGHVDGCVTEAGTAAPLPEVTLRLWTDAWSLVGTARSDAEGTYRFEGLEAAPHIVTVDVPPGFVCESPERSVVPGRRADFVLRRAVPGAARIPEAGLGSGMGAIAEAAP